MKRWVARLLLIASAGFLGGLFGLVTGGGGNGRRGSDGVSVGAFALRPEFPSPFVRTDRAGLGSALHGHCVGVGARIVAGRIHPARSAGLSRWVGGAFECLVTLRFGSQCRCRRGKVVFAALVALCAGGCGTTEPSREPVVQFAPGMVLHPMGSFILKSNALVVCDPCYGAPDASQNPNMHGVISRAKPGEWRAVAALVGGGAWAGRCAGMTVHHVDHERTGADRWHPASAAIWVDSGQAGVFELQTVGLGSVVPSGYFGSEGPLVPDQLWYSMCCKQTLVGPAAGVVPGGAVASSGFGDGTYEWCYLEDREGVVVAVRIVFLSEDDLTPDG